MKNKSNANFLLALFFIFLIVSCGPDTQHISELIEGGLYKEAEQEAIKGLTKEPKNSRLQYLMGVSQLSQHNKNDSYYAFNRAIKFSKNKNQEHQLRKDIGAEYLLLVRWYLSHFCECRATGMLNEFDDAIKTLLYFSKDYDEQLKKEIKSTINESVKYMINTEKDRSDYYLKAATKIYYHLRNYISYPRNEFIQFTTKLYQENDLSLQGRERCKTFIGNISE